MMEKIQKAKESFVNLSELLVSLTNNVICRVILGRMYEGKDFKNLLEGTLELLGLISQP
ncbi:putative psoralen synthase [Helianthus annuus]|nr:putative psoralen synthase [Helianthus annuus]KAJ0554711.1 putative psoralen synthase [Helianthus annuus]KAJ0720274.1 putative psoralen synthase [Helianthus annuus]